MSALTKHALASSTGEQVFDLITKELDHRLGVDRSSPHFVRALRELPPGLRAMAATYELDVSLALNDLGWHFGNWHDVALAEETAAGLEELGATELAGLSRQTFGLAQQYWSELGAANWSEWYHGSPLEKALEPLNEQAWSLLQEKWNGIFSYWVAYTRLQPERME